MRDLAPAMLLDPPAPVRLTPRRPPPPIARSPAQQTYSIILPTDDRQVVGNVSVAPWSGLVRIVASTGAAQEQGTGFLVSPTWVLTAAHVLDAGGVAPVIGINFADGSFTSADILPYPPWRSAPAIGNDIVLLRARSPAPAGAFVFTPLAVEDAWLAALKGARNGVHVAGYPASTGGSLEAAAGPVVSWSSSIIQHDVDTTQGQSGGPLFYAAPAATYVIGVHGHGDIGDVARPGVHNRAARLTQAAVSWITAAIAQG